MLRCRRKPLSRGIPAVQVAVVPEPGRLSGSDPNPYEGFQRIFPPCRPRAEVRIDNLTDQRGHADSQTPRLFSELPVLLQLQGYLGSMHAGGFPLGERQTYIIGVFVYTSV